MISAPNKESIKALIKRSNFLMDRHNNVDSCIIQNFNKNYEIQTVSSDGNCFFRSIIRSLQKLDKVDNYKWFLSFCLISQDIGQPLHTILRKICVKTIIKILFSDGNNDQEGILDIDPHNTDKTALEIKRNRATLYIVDCLLPDININFRYRYENDLAVFFLEKYLISQSESSYDLEKINKDKGFLDIKLKNKIKAYFSKIIKDGIYVDSELLGPVVEYLFNINLKVVYFDNYIPRWVKKSDFSQYGPYNKDDSKPYTIHIVIYSNIEHFDALIPRKEYYNDKEFEIIQTKNINSIKETENKNGHVLETVYSPSFQKNPKLSSFDTIRYDFVKPKKLIELENDNLPESLPIYCAQIVSHNVIELGYIGRLLKINTTIQTNYGLQYYVSKLSNFDDRPFHKNHSCISQWNAFRIDPEHLTDKQKELIDYNPEWFQDSMLTMYEYGTGSKSEPKKIGIKPKYSNESLYFTTSIKDEISENFFRYFILEVNQNEGTKNTQGDIKDVITTVIDNYSKYLTSNIYRY